MSRIKPLILSARSRADFYHGLSRLLLAGIPADKAVATLNDTRQPKLATAIEQTARQLSSGNTFSVAGKRYGLISQQDQGLIQAGENSGALGAVTQALAEQYEAQAQRIARFKSRMIFPAVILVLGIFLAPIPGLFNGSLDATGYLARTLLPLLLSFVGGYLLASNHMHSHTRGSTSLVDAIFNLLPVGKNLTRRLNRLYFLERLGLYLGCGVDAEKAFRLTISEILHPDYRRQYRAALTHLKSGNSISDSLRSADILDDSNDYPIISAGEAAGQLEEGLLRQASWHRQELEQQYDLIAEWAPRVIYGLVAGWFILGLVS
mgnify:CR=1 FL=1